MPVVCVDGEPSVDLFSFGSLYQSYLDCRKNKRNTHNALQFETDLYYNLHHLSDVLSDRSYRPGRSLCFVVKKPKLREIFAANFADRVVHHLLVRALTPLIEPGWCFDSYACRKGKGTQAAVTRLDTLIRRAGKNNKRAVYYLQLDIRSFFTSINRRLLLLLLERRLRQSLQLKLPPSEENGQLLLPFNSPRGATLASVQLCEKLFWLSRVIVDHDPTGDYIVKGDPKLLRRVPLHKSLFGAEPGYGLPIGNLTSQFFAGVYLDPLDHFVKRTLRLKHYVRYVDDFVLLHHSPEPFVQWRRQIDDFLQQYLYLHLNANSEHHGRVSDGIDFLGYVTRPAYKLVRRRAVNALKKRLIEFEDLLVQQCGRSVMYRMDQELAEKLLALLNGYLAHFAYASSQRLITSLLDNNRYLHVYFSFNGSKAVRRYVLPKAWPALHAQVAGIRKQRQELLWVRLGAFYQLYDDDALWGISNLGLKPLKPRGGFWARCGVPVRHIDNFVRRTLALGHSVALVEESDQRIGHLKIRCLDRVLLPREQAA